MFALGAPGSPEGRHGEEQMPDSHRTKDQDCQQAGPARNGDTAPAWTSSRAGAPARQPETSLDEALDRLREVAAERDDF
jgi:hypothetical protein